MERYKVIVETGEIETAVYEIEAENEREAKKEIEENGGGYSPVDFIGIPLTYFKVKEVKRCPWLKL